MPITINEYIKLIKDPFSVGLYKSLLRQTDLMQVLPFINSKSLVARGLRWNTLPTPDFRKLNGSFTTSEGTTAWVEETLAIYGSAFQADKLLKKTDVAMLRDPVQQQLDMHALAIARGYVDNFFNGDITTEPDGFDGLYRRHAAVKFPARQTVSCATTSSLDVLANATNAAKFVKFLQKALKYANLGSGTSARGAVFMNENSWLGVQEAFRMSGYVDAIDHLEKNWPAYQGVPFVDVGLKLDKSTEIIGDTYSTGGGSDSTRLYICRFGEPDGDVDSPGSDGLTGIQIGPVEVLGPEEYNLYDRYDIQWVHGLQHLGDDYCCALMKNLKFV